MRGGILREKFTKGEYIQRKLIGGYFTRASIWINLVLQ